MFSSMYNFYRRNRKKILVGGVLIGGAVALSKYAIFKFDEWTEMRIKEMEEEAKKQYLFEQNQKTCTSTFLSFVINLRESITDSVQIDNLLAQLKTKPSNKYEIWEEVKLKSMLQFIVAVVSNVLLLVLLKVQINIMGAYMFVSSTSNKGTDISDLQERYLNNVTFFLENGLKHLIADLTICTKDTYADVALKKKISFSQLKHHVVDILSALNELATKKYTLQGHPLAHYVINTNSYNETEDERFSTLMYQTNEMLVSDQCKLVIEECLNTAMDAALKPMQERFIGSQEDPEAIVSVEELSQTSFFKQIEIPVAKVTPALNQQLHEIFKAAPNDFVDSIVSHNTIRQFSEHLFEAFSKSYE